MPKHSITSLHDEAATKLRSLLQNTAKNTEGRFASPELLDAIVWNVVINFMVSLAGNAAYARLVAAREEKVRFKLPDLPGLKSELDKEVEETEGFAWEGLAAELRSLLEDYKLEVDDNLVAQVVAVLRDSTEHGKVDGD